MPAKGKISVLHIAAHLGGGVGRALAALAAQDSAGDGAARIFACLEPPRDRRAADAIASTGFPVLFAPDTAALRREIAAADIVQIEWWHHPLMIKTLPGIETMPARWVIWSHISGLHYPVIPPAFARAAHAFVATTPATLPLLDAPAASIASTGGFDVFPLPARRREPPRAGYLGALNPAKLHPRVMDFFTAIKRPGFTADFYGDETANPGLQTETAALGAQSPIVLRGFCDNPQNILPSLDIFPYLLNPTHYGTTENALLEAMACGAVPVVLDNPVETGIVENNVTGLVVGDPAGFAAAMNRLLDDAPLRARLGNAAAAAVRRAYAPAASAQKFVALYDALLRREKRPTAFTAALGGDPADIFLAGLGPYAASFRAGAPARRALPFLYERSKSSAFHFCDHFPEDNRLAAFTATLRADMTALPPEHR